MGVPKFYRWVSERYPCLSEVVKEYQIPEFDNLYLDMNGIVHVCSHPEDDNPHFRITEEKIFQDIFHYLEVLFRMIKPRKVFMMAIDGVAPRAKMNQQRGRRFRSAREAETLIQKAQEKGEVLPTEARFDSNCITPGTEFMVKLQEQLKYFVVKKVSTDKLWQGPRIYLSGHETPGEGEHKVMDFIRSEKSKDDYDSNTRHCLYGLDADLIMLGLISHEPHFSLLREEVRFGKQNQKRSSTVEETTFHLLHLSLMREYLDFEFSELKDKLPHYDLERVIDDWVLMGFLVGNDFIPHLPDLHIKDDSLPLLWRTYKKVLPTIKGYLHDGGTLNLPNFEKYLRTLAKIDVDKFSDKHADVKWLQSRRRKPKTEASLGSRETGIPTANEFMALRDLDDEEDMVDPAVNGKSDLDVLAETYDFEEEEEEDYMYEEEEDEEGTVKDTQFYREFRKYKNPYYTEKMGFMHVTREVLEDQAEGYVRAIQWVLYYYYHGVPSWSWYYPHHYAPYLSDVRDFRDMKFDFDMSTPFLPFQQLMAVLPALSRALMPQPLQTLMVSEASPVIDYYPVDFETDLNGKQQDWEAVVLIPFIEENRLLAAMIPLEAKMTDEEKARNRHGPHFLYQHASEPQGTYSSGMFPDIVNHRASITEVHMNEFRISVSKLKTGLCQNVKQDVYFPGFPTLKHIPHKAELQKAGVKVFQHVSKGENMMLTILNHQKMDLDQLAQKFIGQSVYVSWPHLEEVRVTALSDGEFRYKEMENTPHRSKQRHQKETAQIDCERLEDDQINNWHSTVSAISENYMLRKGVFIGETQVLVYGYPLAGRKYICGHHGNVILEKQWASADMPFVLQGSVKDISVMDPTYKQYETLDSLFSEKSEVFMLGHPHYGCMGEVLSVDPKNEGRVRVDFSILEEPDIVQVYNMQGRLQTKYFPAYIAGRRLGVTAHLFSRISGAIFVGGGGQNRVNVGLNLKNNKEGTEVPGYTKKIGDDWRYSEKLVAVLGQYMESFPEMFDFISENSSESSYHEKDIFHESGATLADVKKFLKNLPSSSAPAAPHGTEYLEEPIIRVIEAEVNKVKEFNRKKKKHIKMQVRPHLLHRPLEAQLTLVPDPSVVFDLYDRVINARDGFSVPLGLRGTIIGINNAAKEKDITYDVLFDEEFMGGLTIRCSPLRAYRMPACALINLSHGERKSQGKSLPKPTAVVKPQYTPKGNYAGAARGDHNRPQQGGYNKPDYQNVPPPPHGGYRPQPTGPNYQQVPPPQPGYHGNQQVPPPQQGYHGNQQQYHHDNRQGEYGARQGGQQQNWQQMLSQQEFINQGGHGNRHSEVDHYGHNRQPPAPSNQDEFANMWDQLQESPNWAPQTPTTPHTQTSTTPHTQTSNTPHTQPQGSKQKPQGQSSRPPNNKNNLSAQPKVKDTSQGQGQTVNMQKIDLDALFKASEQYGKFKPKEASKTKKIETEKKKSPENKDALNDPDEFQGIFESLQLSDESERSDRQQTDQPHSSREGTAALCQMLNINKDDQDKAAQDTQKKSKTTPNYGKQLSVQELFSEAEQHQGQGQGQIKPQESSKPSVMSACDRLGDWCRSAGLQVPSYDYQPNRDKHRAIITLNNGQVFQGSLARSLGQAAESAARVALLDLTGPHEFPGFGFQQGNHQIQSQPQGAPPRHGPPPQHGQPPQHGPPQHGPPQHGPPQHGPPQHGPHPQHGGSQGPQHGGPRLSVSPNSAFTSVRPPPGMPTGGRPPYTPAWNNRQSFPPPPQFGPPPHNLQGPPPQRYSHPPQNVPRGKGPRGQFPPHQHYPPLPQGHYPGGQGPGGYQMAYPPHSHPQGPEGPPYSHHNPPQPQRDPRSHHPTHESWGMKAAEEDVRGHGNGAEVNQADETPKKANPFIPLQVQRQQKTPQRDGKKSHTSESSDDGEGQCHTNIELFPNPPEGVFSSPQASVPNLAASLQVAALTDTSSAPMVAALTDTSSAPKVAAPSEGSAIREHLKTPPSQAADGSPAERTKDTPQKSPAGSRRPKSRIAANFGFRK